jgi:predicted PurR-regulated permease PerM
MGVAEEGEWRMASTTEPPIDRSSGGDPIIPGFFRSQRRGSGVKRGRRTLILVAVLMIVVVIIGVGLLVFSSISRESQSYKDGYSVGGATYAAVASLNETAQNACREAELRAASQGGRPLRDNATQWIQGCINGFNTAQAGT